MFRLQNNVPEVYVQKSRDFQLLCRLFDSVFAGVKFSTDSVARTCNTKECNDKLLELLKLKLGLFTDIDISNKELRYILQAYPIIIRYKGCIQGVKYVLNLFQRISQIGSEAPIINENFVKDELKYEYNINHHFEVTFSDNVFNDKLLIELLKLVIPTGYTISYAVRNVTNLSTQLQFNNDVQIKVLKDIDNNNNSEMYYNIGDELDIGKLAELKGSTGLTTIHICLDDSIPEENE